MKWDIMVVANPAWETARLVDRIPDDIPPAGSLDPAEASGQSAGSDSAPGLVPGAASGILVTDGGGSALNTACALARAGRRVLAVGRVGDDPAGHACLAALRRHGVESACEILPGRTTKRNTCFVERGSRETAFAVEVPERSVPPWEDRPAALLEARVLLLDRLAAGAPGWLRERRVALRAEPAVPPFMNALVRNSAILSPAGRARFEAALPFLDYLQLSEDPAAPMTPQPPALDRGRVHRPQASPPLAPHEVEAILGSGVRYLARTRGADGMLLHAPPQGVATISAKPIAVVDPTGAGDAFAAGFLHAILGGSAPEGAAELGVEWASRACLRLGARGWLDHGF